MPPEDAPFHWHISFTMAILQKLLAEELPIPSHVDAIKITLILFTGVVPSFVLVGLAESFTLVWRPIRTPKAL